jgi:uncharacterized membrane protein
MTAYFCHVLNIYKHTLLKWNLVISYSDMLFPWMNGVRVVPLCLSAAEILRDKRGGLW